MFIEFKICLNLPIHGTSDALVGKHFHDVKYSGKRAMKEKKFTWSQYS